MTRRGVLRVVFAAAVPLLILIAAAGWLLGTESGLHFAYDRVRGAGVPLTVARMEGTLAGDLSLQGVHWEPTEGPRAAIERLELNWAPLGLLVAQVRFQQLHAAGVEVVIPETEEPPEPAEDGGLPLPLGVAVRDGLVHDLTVVTPGNSFHVDRADLSARYRGSRIRIRRLEAEGPGFAVALEGRLGLLPDSRVRLESRWRLTMQQRRYVGGGRIGGRLSALELEQRLSEPVALSLTGTLRWLDQPLQWQAALQAEPFVLDRLHPALPPWRGGGTVNGGGGVEAFTATAELSLHQQQFGRWAISGELARDGAEWRIPDLTARSGERRLAFDGVWRTAGRPRMEAQLTWRDLGWPLTGEQAVRSGRGELMLTGEPDDYRFRLEGLAGTPTIPATALRGSGSGNLQRLNIARLAGEWLDGRWSAEGRIDWSEGLAWEAGLSAEGIDPEALAPDWPGDITGRLTSRGQFGEGGLRFSADLEQLDGRLRGQPLSGRVSLAVADGAIRLAPSRLEYGNARFSARGELARKWDLAWALRVPRLEGLAPGLSGDLRGSGAVAGPREAPALQAQLSGSTLDLQGVRIAELSAELSGSLAQREPWDADVVLRDLRWSGVQLQSLTLDGGGTAAEHELRLEAEAERWHLQQRLTGSLDGADWRGTLLDGVLRAPTGPWRQQAPSMVAWSAAGPSLESFCWGGPGAARLCAAADSAGETPGTVLRLQTRQLPLALLEPWLPRRDLVLEGAVEGNGWIRLADGIAGFDFDLAAGPGRLSLPAPGAEPLALDFRTLAVEGRGGPDGAAAAVRLQLLEQGTAMATVRLPRWRPGEPFGAGQPLEGAANLALNELDWLSLLVPQLVAPRGQIDGRMSLAGTIGDPTVDGQLRLHDASVAVPALGISLERLALRVRPAPDAFLAIDGEAQSGDGAVTLDGSVTNPPGQPWLLLLGVTGEQFLAVQLPQYRIVASPDLQVRAQPGRIDLTGRIRIPTAQVNLPEIPAVAQPSPDVVVLGREDRDPGWIIRSDVEVTLGDSVRVQGYGFSGRIDGWLRVSEQAAGIATARGTLNIRDGRYEAYGQKFVIEQGRLLYAQAPLDNPGISFRAVRELEQEEITVGISVTGRLQQPTVRLFSEPSMEESDILSYLVLGRPLQSASEQEAFDLARVATSLGLAGGGRVAERIGQEFGFDVVKVESAAENEDAALVLGKFLSPRLYVQYAVGLWEAVNTFRIRYDLGGGWMLEAQEGGNESSTDLLYSIER